MTPERLAKLEEERFTHPKQIRINQEIRERGRKYWREREGLPLREVELHLEAMEELRRVRDEQHRLRVEYRQLVAARQELEKQRRRKNVLEFTVEQEKKAIEVLERIA